VGNLSSNLFNTSIFIMDYFHLRKKDNYKPHNKLRYLEKCYFFKQMCWTTPWDPRPQENGYLFRKMFFLASRKHRCVIWGNVSMFIRICLCSLRNMVIFPREFYFFKTNVLNNPTWLCFKNNMHVLGNIVVFLEDMQPCSKKDAYVPQWKWLCSSRNCFSSKQMCWIAL